MIVYRNGQLNVSWFDRFIYLAFFQKILGLQVFPPQSIHNIVIFQLGAGMQHGDKDDHEYPGHAVEDLFPREYEGKLKHIAKGIDLEGT